MSITALPTSPSRSGGAATFSDTADTWVSAIPTFVTEANDLAADVTTKSTTATTQAASSSASAVLSAASASNSEVSNLAAQAAMALAYGYAGLPAPADYGQIFKTEGAENYKNSAFTAAVSRTYDVDTTSGAFDITMPSSPVVGSWIAFRSYLQSHKLNRAVLKYGSDKINAKAEDCNLNVNFIVLVYTDSTQGWII